MDALRVEGESNFLEFLPASMRKEIMQSWYKGVDLKKVYHYPTAMPAGIEFRHRRSEAGVHRANRKRAHVLPGAAIVIRPGELSAGGRETYPPLPEKYETAEDYLQGFRVPGRTRHLVLLPFQRLPRQPRVRADTRPRRRRRGDLHRDQPLARQRRLPLRRGGRPGPRPRTGPISSRASSARTRTTSLDIREEDLPDFFDLLATFALRTEDGARFLKYGVNRADEQLWETYDWFQERFNKDEPVRAGLFDLNRYHYKVLK